MGVGKLKDIADRIRSLKSDSVTDALMRKSLAGFEDEIKTLNINQLDDSLNAEGNNIYNKQYDSYVYAPSRGNLPPGPGKPYIAKNTGKLRRTIKAELEKTGIEINSNRASIEKIEQNLGPLVGLTDKSEDELVVELRPFFGETLKEYLTDGRI